MTEAQMLVVEGRHHAPQAETTLDSDVLRFHRTLPGYAPTPLRPLRHKPGVGDMEIWVKDETRRLGLPSFKVLGASWATYRAVSDRVGATSWSDCVRACSRLTPEQRPELVAATDGNHGRAVAHLAHVLGLGCRVFVPNSMAAARIEAIAAEGADIVVVDGTYDDAIRRSAAEISEGRLVISDTSWPGYEETPRHVIDGYSTIFAEIADSQRLGEAPGFDAAFIQVGVGALAASAVRCLEQHPPGPRLIAVEPMDAACLLASMRAGEVVSVPGPHRSVMVGLNCGTPSPLAWPVVSQGFNVFLAIPDDRAREAVRVLHREGISAGETGAAGLAGLLALGAVDQGLEHSGVRPDARVLVICTEGPTDPVSLATSLTPEEIS